MGIEEVMAAREEALKQQKIEDLKQQVREDIEAGKKY